MDPERPDHALLERYARLLGVEPAAPSLALLERIVRAQLMRVPFENISKLYDAHVLGRPGLPPLERHLAGLEKRLGGTCYANNGYLALLLEHLGFDATLCGADMGPGEDVHAVIIVRVEGREFLVDAGYAAPFYRPLPRDLGAPLEIAFGTETFVLQPADAKGRSVVEHHRDGELVHGYIAKPRPRHLSDFETVARASFAPESTFMNAIRLVRFLPDRSIAIANHALVVSTARRAQVTRLPTRDAIVDAIEEHFGIAREIAAPAVASAGKLRSTQD